ncbi:MAG: CDP-diacylglycerol--glycerol-3-phosphate 3-phosphatidyltransferase [Desulfobulbaceae bacterium]|nr:CDP-diacylglycerol--glycerol-3-phosphate 3-phosphatidyltransferase [Desulfobulbaceae bacterium]HIJ79109.1 CDP-diacylglycerol--glycerol-3-phosphate 3-phosphatidyltransferase [Deltaproteobacteria bacterium]
MNIPNLLTLARVLLIPLLVIFLLEGKVNYAFWVFMVAGVTDALDGFLARALKQKTDFGAFIDPIADKLLLITSFVTLAALDLLPNWITVLVVSRDVLILGGIGILTRYRRPVPIKPSLVSKVTTFLQLVTVVFQLGRGYLAGYLFLNEPIIYLTAFFTIISGVHYLVIGSRILGKPESAQ